MRRDQARSGEWSDAVCAIMWVDGRDGARLLRWLPAYMTIKGNRIRDRVRNVEHVLVAGCVVVIKKNGSVEII